ncbi:MAG: imidazole glycerol phosphate synthase subunit HisH [Acidobacteriaceae bacterium]|nr:imidazole glycerol phosphate synthase subunit HisH [Acidobacteriaceae bacterium]
MKTTIVDYGAGNIRSVENTLHAIGADYQTTNDPAIVSKAEKIILPGVGHFGQMMRAMDDLGLRQPIIDKIHSGTPFLGICVGLQCLFQGSEESLDSKGLAIFPGTVKRFIGDARIPHMGWNSLALVKPARLLCGLANEPFTFFAHSYYGPVIDATVATCTYMNPYSAVLEQDNVHAVQFHPEKSGAIGLQVMKNFIEL